MSLESLWLNYGLDISPKIMPMDTQRFVNHAC